MLKAKPLSVVVGSVIGVVLIGTFFVTRGTGDAARVDSGLPFEALVTDTSGLHDGDEVSLRVVPKGGSQVFGFEAFLCAGDVQIAYDADIRPTQTGKCVSKPLSAISDDYKEVRADPSYEFADGRFRVGVGKDTYTMDDGEEVTITCGPDHPCQLALKAQFPNGFGFVSYPVTYA